MGKALSVPPAAVLGGLLIITRFVISPAVVTVPGTSWVEPALIWLTVSMPTGSRKTTIYQFLCDILAKIRRKCQCKGELLNVIIVYQQLSIEDVQFPGVLVTFILTILLYIKM